MNAFRAADVPVLAIDQISKPSEPGVCWVQGSVNDSSFLRQVIDTGDNVFHFANSGFPGSPLEWQDGLRSLDGLNELCCICAETNSRLMFPSSGGTVYGEAMEIPIKENHLIEPISTYGLVKKMSEEVIAYHGRTKGLRYVVLRISNCYGAAYRKDKPHGIIGVAIQSVLAQQPLYLVGKGTQVRDFIHSRDVAALCFAVFQSGVDAAIVNAGSGRGVSMCEVVHMVASALKHPLTVELLPARSFDVHSNVLDSTQAQKLFGWEAQVSLEEGVKEICSNV